MLQFFLIVALLVAISFAGMAVGILVRGKFPDTHVGRNAGMKNMGITCAKNDGTICQGRPARQCCDGAGRSKKH